MGAQRDVQSLHKALSKATINRLRSNTPRNNTTSTGRMATGTMITIMVMRKSMMEDIRM